MGKRTVEFEIERATTTLYAWVCHPDGTAAIGVTMTARLLDPSPNESSEVSPRTDPDGCVVITVLRGRTYRITIPGVPGDMELTIRPELATLNLGTFRTQQKL